MGAVIGGGQVIHARKQGTEGPAVRNDAADADAAEADAMIATLTADQAGPRALADDILVGEGDLQRRIHRLRARIAEEHMVEAVGCQRRDTACQREGGGMAVLEGGREIQFRRRGSDRLDDGRTIVPGIGTPKSRRAIEDRAAFGRVIMHVLSAGDEPRALLEGAVRSERHPEGVQVVGDHFAGGPAHHLI